MTDLEVLGLKENYTLEELKDAFRRKSKILHPDCNESSLESHKAMIKLNQAYSNLLQKREMPKITAGKKETADDSYEIYRRAMENFMTIHPSKWKAVRKEGLFNPGAVVTDEETPNIIKSMIDRMASAYHDFSRVVSEHPNSPWAFDAKNKMKEIEKMTRRYMIMLKSYEGSR